MAYTTESVPDLTGRVAVVTGANGGLGLAIAEAFTGAGAHTVIAARNLTKAESARTQLRAANPAASVEIVELDLGSLASVEAAAGRISVRHDRVDILVNNAGLMALPHQLTADGFEMQFGVNHLGHWAFTAHLMPNLLAADGARVVAQTSFARHGSRGINAENPHLAGEYAPWRAYNQSKLANFLFALGLQDAFDEAGVAAMSFAAHPGFTNSDIQAHTQSEGGGGFVAWASNYAARFVGMSTARGALPVVRAATDPDATGGTLYAPRFGTSGAAVQRPVVRPGREQAIAELWELSERETGVKLVVG